MYTNDDRGRFVLEHPYEWEVVIHEDDPVGMAGEVLTIVLFASDDVELCEAAAAEWARMVTFPNHYIYVRKAEHWLHHKTRAKKKGS